VREFRSGESPRSIYWKRSARGGQLVAKQMTQVSPPRVLLLVDSFLADRSLEQHALIERVVAMAASIASTALEEGMAVGLYAWADGWTGIHPTRGKRQREDLLSILAQLPLNTAHRTDELLDRRGRSSSPARRRCSSRRATCRSATPTAGGGRSGRVGRSAWPTRGSASGGVDFRTCMRSTQQPRTGPGRPGAAAPAPAAGRRGLTRPGRGGGSGGHWAGTGHQCTTSPVQTALTSLLLLGMLGFALAAESPGVWVMGTAGIMLNAWLVTRPLRPDAPAAGERRDDLRVLYVMREMFVPNTTR
jgi:hypothetical protein